MTDLTKRIRALERAARPLEPGSTRRKRMRNALGAAAERFLRRLGTSKAYEATEHQGSGLLEVPIGERGIPLERAIALLERDVIAPGAQPASGRMLAYIPGGGLYHSALADFMAAITNKYAGIFYSGPGAVRMENMLVRWVADLVGYPPSAGGSIASGGSIANLTAIVAARDAHNLRAADYARAVVYVTGQSHHSIAKALRIAGLAEAQVRPIAVDARYRLRADALAETIEADRASGLTPWLIVATAGTTDTGAVDPLDAIADIAQPAGCWFHVDAAYGGFFLLTEHGRALLRGIERSDSAVLDPHKGLFLPWGAGIVVVRDVEHLLASHRHTGSYMQDTAAMADTISPADVSLELTKHFRGLRMWLPLVLEGIAPFRAALEEKLLLARVFRDRVAELGYATGPVPDLSIVTFRWAPDGVPLEVANRMNRDIQDAVRIDGRVFLSSTMLDGAVTLRMVALGVRTHLREIEIALTVLREQAERLRATTDRQ